jgi:pilus assembly protein CpaC
VPALSTRRVDTEVELQSGQSFAIAGLLDNQTTESLSKIPGLSDIPLLGKLFTSKNINRSNSELIVIVTPELVEPIPEGQNVPDLQRPAQFLEGPGIMTQAPRTPGTDQTGRSPARLPRTEISVQEMQQLQKASGQQVQSGASQTGPAFPLVITPAAPPPTGDSGGSAGTTPGGASPGRSN